MPDKSRVARIDNLGYQSYGCLDWTSMDVRDTGVGDGISRKISRVDDTIVWVEMADCEQRLVYALPRIFGPGHYINLGHARGGSAMLLAKGLCDRSLDGEVTSVDLFFPNHGGWELNHKRLIRHEIDHLVTMVNGKTKDIGLSMCKNGIEVQFVFVDANHHYKFVCDDIKIWTPMVKVGGGIAFHDTNLIDVDTALKKFILSNPKWKEREDLHIHSIRVFERCS